MNVKRAISLGVGSVAFLASLLTGVMLLPPGSFQAASLIVVSSLISTFLTLVTLQVCSAFLDADSKAWLAKQL